MKKNFFTQWSIILLMFGAILLFHTPATLHAATPVGNSISAKQNLKSAKTFKKGDFEYAILKNGTIEITKYTGSAKKVDVPQKIDKKKVTSIGEYAFSECTKVTNVELPKTVNSIGRRAFWKCENLKKINIPKGVTKIENATFRACEKLEAVELPKGITSIGKDAFYNCFALKTVTLPDSVTELGEDCFYNCNSLKAIALPNSLKLIRKSAFGRCIALEEINIPDSVTKISENAFSQCYQLTKVTLPKGLTKLYNNTFYNCKQLEEITIPDSVTALGQRVFADCNKLQKVHLPKKLTSIGSGAFKNCQSLTEINIPNGVTKIGSSAFCNCRKLEHIELPDSIKAIGSYAFVSCAGLKNIKIPNGVSAIRKETFSHCSNLSDVTLPEGIKTIDFQAFIFCRSLENINLPHSLSKIGTSAFYDCKKLTEITIPDGTLSLGKSAFTGCTDLTNIEIPESVTDIGPNLLSSCPKVTVSCEKDSLAYFYAQENNIPYTVLHKAEQKITGIAQYIKSADSPAFTLDITIIDGDGTLSYESSDTSVANVADDGTVTVTGEGKAVITVTASETSEYTESTFETTITVKKGEDVGIAVTDIELSHTTAQMSKGDTLTLTAKVKPSNAADTGVVWESSNKRVAKVDSYGNVKAVSYGTAIIAAIAADGSGTKATCEITVPYKIIYKLNKGINHPLNPDTYLKENIILQDPQRKGYKFRGWYTDEDFKNEITVIKKYAKSNYTLYAKWEKAAVSQKPVVTVDNDQPKKLFVSYTSIPTADGYEISYSTDKNFKKSVKTKELLCWQSFYTIKNLKKGKTYYIRVRAYQVDSTGAKIYGPYSKVKKIKIIK